MTVTDIILLAKVGCLFLCVLVKKTPKYKKLVKYIPSGIGLEIKNYK